MKFKEGDRVRHKLGGYEMFVISVSARKKLVYCRRYIPDKNEFKKEAFREEELELVEEI